MNRPIVEANSAALVAKIEGKKPEPPKTYADSLISYKPIIQEALGGAMPIDQFVRMVITTVKGESSLFAMAKKNPLSVVQSAIKIATWGLNLSIPNEVSLIPWEGKTQAITPMIGYKGLQRLAMQAGVEFGFTYQQLESRIIYQHDQFERSFGSDGAVTHKPPKFGDPRGKPIGYYAISRDQFGRACYEEMTVEEMAAHKARYCRAKKGPFAGAENFDRYGVKTMMRLLISRNLPMSPKLASAVTADIKLETEDTPELDELPAIEAAATPIDEEGQQ